MDAFIFAVNTILPIVLLVVIGYVLKRIGMFSEDFLKVANKLIFHLFIPVMVFNNVYKIQSISELNFGFVLYGALALITIFLLATLGVILFEKDDKKKGALISGVIRSNYAIIGIPVATMLFGEEGAKIATLMIALVIPLSNVLGVISLSVFTDGAKKTVWEVVKSILTNPLILGVASGFAVLLIRAILRHFGITFQIRDIGFVAKTLDYLGQVGTPLSLIVLGGGFTFKSAKELFKEISIGVIARCVLVPTLTITLAHFFLPNLTGGEYACLVAFFATPNAVSTAVMTREMNGDYELSAQLVVWTTIFSSFSIFVCAFILRTIGIF